MEHPSSSDVYVAQDAWQTPSAEEAEGGELASAQESLQEAEKSGTLKQSTSMESLMQVMHGPHLASWMLVW